MLKIKKLLLLFVLLLVISCKPVTEEVKEEDLTVNITTVVENVTVEPANATTDIPSVSSNISTETEIIVKEEIITEEELGFGFNIYYPKPNLKIRGSLLSLSLRLNNISIGEFGGEHKQGFGHFHVRVGIPDNETFVEMEDVQKTFRNLPEGNNTFFVEMVRNDHKSYNLTKNVTFIVPKTGVI